jgi:hypothetical protein
MDYGTISEKIARLRMEMNRIRAENRLYFAKKHHTEIEVLQHNRRGDHLQEIKLELETMLKRKAG